MPKMSDHEEFLNATMVKDGDSVVLLDAGIFREPEETGLQRTVFQLRVGLPDQRTKTWTMNKTTRNRLALAWGDDSESWVGKSVRLQILKQNVRGDVKSVIYGFPSEAQVQQHARPQVDPKTLNKETLENLIEVELVKAAGLLTRDAAIYLVSTNLGVTVADIQNTLAKKQPNGLKLDLSTEAHSWIAGRQEIIGQRIPYPDYNKIALSGVLKELSDKGIVAMGTGTDKDYPVLTEEAKKYL